MNKANWIILFFFVAFIKVNSQDFGKLSYTDNNILYIERILVDSLHDELIMSSKWMNYVAGKKVRGVCSWNGSEWDSLKGGINTHDILNNQPNGNILAGITYNGKFLAGGNFESIGRINATSLATWDGNNWDSLPVRAFKFLDYGASIYGLLKYNNKLYISGYFDTIQGQKANGLATFDGVSFQPVQVPLQTDAGILDMKIYNGELYISGIFTYTAQAGNENILKFDGANWVSVGGGIKGNTSSIASMAVYNNELYAGGYFLTSAGNVSDIIMKWDGTNWHDVSWGHELQNGGIWKLLVYHSKLYAFGSFNLAGNKKASKVAVYDGRKWCTYADSLDGTVYSAAVYKDTVFIAGGFKSITSDTALKFIAKLSQPNNIDDCGEVGFKENYLEPGLIYIYPNPTANKCYIEFADGSQHWSLVLYNSLGQKVYSVDRLERKSEINLESLKSGLYYLKIFNDYGEIFYKIAKE